MLHQIFSFLMQLMLIIYMGMIFFALTMVLLRFLGWPRDLYNNIIRRARVRELRAICAVLDIDVIRREDGWVIDDTYALLFDSELSAMETAIQWKKDESMNWVWRS